MDKIMTIAECLNKTYATNYKGFFLLLNFFTTGFSYDIGFSSSTFSHTDHHQKFTNLFQVGREKIKNHGRQS